MLMTILPKRTDLGLAPAGVYRAQVRAYTLRSLGWRLRGGGHPDAQGFRILFYHRVSDEQDELAGDAAPVRRADGHAGHRGLPRRRRRHRARRGAGRGRPRLRRRLRRHRRARAARARASSLHGDGLPRHRRHGRARAAVVVRAAAGAPHLGRRPSGSTEARSASRLTRSHTRTCSRSTRPRRARRSSARSRSWPSGSGGT